MRRELLRCFDDIYILDLHGNNRKKETAPDGSKDENVFDIMQGVSINIFIRKKSCDRRPASIHHFDLFGSRNAKYSFLTENNLASISWNIIQPQEPDLFFVPKDFGAKAEYELGFRIDHLMKVSGSGIQFRKDNLLVHFSEKEVEKMLQDMQSLSASELAEKYDFNETKDWLVKDKRQFFKLDKENILL